MTFIDGTKLTITHTGPEWGHSCKRHRFGSWDDHYPEIGVGSRCCATCGETEMYEMVKGKNKAEILDQLEAEIFLLQSPGQQSR